MSLTTVLIARAIATTAAAHCGLPNDTLVIEDVDTNHMPYEGVMVYARGNDERVVHIYLCDDDKDSEIWMVDPSNVATGSVDPRPLTAEFLQFAMEYLCADAWLLRSPQGDDGITTDYEIARMWDAGLRCPLNGTPRGNLLGWLDPNTGDLASDGLKNMSAVYARFNKPLYSQKESC